LKLNTAIKLRPDSPNSIDIQMRYRKTSNLSTPFIHIKRQTVNAYHHNVLIQPWSLTNIIQKPIINWLTRQ